MSELAGTQGISGSLNIPARTQRLRLERAGGADVTPLTRRSRVGHIEFLNCFPLLWGLAKTGGLRDLELVRGTPADLSDALVNGRLDVGPVSLVELLKNTEDLVVLPDIAISSDGPVMSCLIISQSPLSQLDRLPVALGSTSRTSVMLAQLLLSDLIGVHPQYFVCPPDLSAMLDKAAAAVVIGDTALRAALYEAPKLGLKIYDLGKMWHDWTTLPFVFALFAARREFVEREPEMVSRIHTDLLRARDFSLAAIDRICEQAASSSIFDAATLIRYYTTALDFRLGDRHLAGIAEFTRRAMRQGLHFFPQTQLRLFKP